MSGELADEDRDRSYDPPEPPFDDRDPEWESLQASEPGEDTNYFEPPDVIEADDPFNAPWMSDEELEAHHRYGED